VITYLLICFDEDKKEISSLYIYYVIFGHIVELLLFKYIMIYVDMIMLILFK